MGKRIQKSDTYRIIGLCLEVHRVSGFGFSEIVYKEALEVESLSDEIPFIREQEYDILYKGHKLKHKYFADFVMFENSIVEIKATGDGIDNEHISQTFNYMKAAGNNVGLIINFGKKALNTKDLFSNLC